MREPIILYVEDCLFDLFFLSVTMIVLAVAFMLGGESVILSRLQRVEPLVVLKPLSVRITDVYWRLCKGA